MKIAIFVGSFKPPHRGHLFLVEKILATTELDKLYVIISPKPRNGITQEQSIRIWNIYLQSPQLAFAKDKIKLVISTTSSPVMMAYDIAKKLKTDDELLLIKSGKDAKNTRYEMIKKLGKEKNFAVQEMVLPQLEKLSATNMRQAIKADDKQTFFKFLPTKLAVKNKLRIWKLLN